MKYFKVSSKRSCVKFSINMLQLGHTSLAENHLGIEEVETLIFELNYADQEKYILEEDGFDLDKFICNKGGNTHE